MLNVAGSQLTSRDMGMDPSLQWRRQNGAPASATVSLRTRASFHPPKVPGWVSRSVGPWTLARCTASGTTFTSQSSVVFAHTLITRAAGFLCKTCRSDSDSYLHLGLAVALHRVIAAPLARDSVATLHESCIRQILTLQSFASKE